MAKELPFFKFEPAEYLTRDVSFCSLSAQGLFINICSYYWQRSCNLMKKQLLRRFNNKDELNELINEGVIDLDGEKISIKFLDVQYKEVLDISNKNSINGKKGGAKKGNSNASKTTQKQPKNNPKTTQKQGIREDKIREDKIREENIINNVVFSEECKKSMQWKETVAMTNKISADAVDLFIGHFEQHLINHQEQKKLLKDFKSHFSNWLPKQDLSSFRIRAPLGKTNQISA